MSDFENKLNAILSSPDAMAQVAALAQQLSGGEQASAPPPESPPLPPTNQPNLSALGDLLGGVDPTLIAKLLPLLGELNGPANDQRAALVHALHPFLRPERQKKVDQALKLARIISIGKKVLGQLGE